MPHLFQKLEDVKKMTWDCRMRQNDLLAKVVAMEFLYDAREVT